MADGGHHHYGADVLGCKERLVYEKVKKDKLKAIRLGIRAIRILEPSLNECIKSNTVDQDEYFGFEETRDPDSDLVYSRIVIRLSWVDK